MSSLFKNRLFILFLVVLVVNIFLKKFMNYDLFNLSKNNILEGYTGKKDLPCVEYPKNIDDPVELQTNVEDKISRNLYINILIFFLFCVVWVSLMGFGTPLLLASGILFGKWIGTLVSVISISVGALILYLIANFFFKDLVYRLLEKRIASYIYLFKKK